VLTPANENLFSVDDSKLLDKTQAEQCHIFMAEGLFAFKRGRVNIQPATARPCTQVQEPNEGDWTKLVKMMKCLNGTKESVLVLSAKTLKVVKWCVDAALAVHPDCKSHTGAMMTMGKGGVANISRNQKLDTRSSTTAELVAADDAVVMMS